MDSINIAQCKFFYNFKKVNQVMSEYSFEYITALLMNLSLRTLGKIYCEDPDL